MDAKRAAEVLLKNKDLRVLRAHSVEVEEATDLGAQAMDAWAWVNRTGATVELVVEGWQATVYVDSEQLLYTCAPTPLAAVLDAMEKERKG